MILNAAIVVLCLVGAFFFLAGTVGLLRFPDTFSRLHALTKADNLGLGFIIAGLCLANASWPVTFKLIIIWILAMLASSTACYLLGRLTLRHMTPGDRDHDTV